MEHKIEHELHEHEKDAKKEHEDLQNALTKHIREDLAEHHKMAEEIRHSHGSSHSHDPMYHNSKKNK